MRAFRQLLSFAGWVTDNALQLGSFNHADRYDRWLLALICGALCAFAAWFGYLAFDAAATTWVPLTVAEASSDQAPGDGTHVEVTGSVAVVYSCQPDGCRRFSSLSDDYGHIVYFVGPSPNAEGYGIATVKGTITKGPPANLARMISEHTWVPSNPSATAIWVDGRGINDQPLVGLIIAVLVAGWAGLMAASYRIGIVPFEPSPPGTVMPARLAAGERHEIRCRVTGSFKTLVGEASFRSRDTRLQADEGGVILEMSLSWPLRLGSRLGRGGGFSPDMAVIVRGNVVSVSPGTAHLVFGTRPALRLTTTDGHMLLAFDNPKDRDTVLGRLSEWAHPLASRRPGSKGPKAGAQDPEIVAVIGPYEVMPKVDGADEVWLGEEGAIWAEAPGDPILWREVVALGIWQPEVEGLTGLMIEAEIGPTPLAPDARVRSATVCIGQPGDVMAARATRISDRLLQYYLDHGVDKAKWPKVDLTPH